MNYLKPEMGWQSEWDKMGEGTRIEVDALYLKKMLARQNILDRVIVFGKALAEAPDDARARVQAKYDQAVADAWALDTRPPKFPVEPDERELQTVKDLSAMIRRLTNRMRMIKEDDPLIAQALDLVERKGAKVQILRQSEDM